MDRVAPDQGHQGLQVEKIQAKAKERRYLLSPVGRRIPIRSMYYALVFLEQGSEADVMKLARLYRASRPAEFRRRPLSERCVRLASHRSHQANVPVMPIRQ
jgi:hypothetical protein